MKMTEIELYTEVIFEKIKHYTEEGVEFWYARELQKVLEYKEWRNFLKAVNKAKEACEMAQQSMIDHFVDVNNMVELGSGSKREVEDIMLSRYACYLIVMNGDSHKEEVLSMNCISKIPIYYELSGNFVRLVIYYIRCRS